MSNDRKRPDKKRPDKKRPVEKPVQLTKTPSTASTAPNAAKAPRASEASEASEASKASKASKTPKTANAGRTRRLAVPVTLGVLTLALALIGALLLVRAHTLRTTGPVANKAVIDEAATNQVIGQVSTALNQVLSYDYQKPQLAKQAAQRWLTGDAPKQYRLLFSELQKLAPGQKLTLTARVVSAGVSSLKGDTAQLLVFLDQQSTRASDKQSSISAAQVQITAVHQGKTWRVSELHPL